MVSEERGVREAKRRTDEGSSQGAVNSIAETPEAVIWSLGGFSGDMAWGGESRAAYGVLVLVGRLDADHTHLD